LLFWSISESRSGLVIVLPSQAPLEYHFMAGKAQEVQVRDVNIGSGDIDGKLLKGNFHRGGVFCHSRTCSNTYMGFSESHIDSEAGNLHCCFLTYLGTHRQALGERMPRL